MPIVGGRTATSARGTNRHERCFNPFVMNQLFAKSAAEVSLQPNTKTERAHGAVHRVDTVEREISVLISTGLAVFDVPSDCPILLRGEPIKLRLIQPRDQVRIAFTDYQGRLIAHLLEVQPDTGFSCFRL